MTGSERLRKHLKCNARMGKSPRIDDDPRYSLLFRSMYPFYEGALMVTLKHINRGAQAPARARSRSSIASSVSAPYVSGSRVPRRFRLGRE